MVEVVADRLALGGKRKWENKRQALEKADTLDNAREAVGSRGTTVLYLTLLSMSAYPGVFLEDIFVFIIASQGRPEPFCLLLKIMKHEKM